LRVAGRLLFYALEMFVWIGQGVVMVFFLPVLLVRELFWKEKQ